MLPTYFVSSMALEVAFDCCTWFVRKLPKCLIFIYRFVPSRNIEEANEMCVRSSIPQSLWCSLVLRWFRGKKKGAFYLVNRSLLSYLVLP